MVEAAGVEPLPGRCANYLPALGFPAQRLGTAEQSVDHAIPFHSAAFRRFPFPATAFGHHLGTENEL